MTRFRTAILSLIVLFATLSNSSFANGILIQEKYQEVIDTFASALETPDADLRKKILDQTVNSNIIQRTRLGTTNNVEELIAQIENYRRLVPDLKQEVEAAVFTANYAQYGWVVRDGKGNTMAEGMNIVKFDQESKIVEIVAFFL